MTETLTIHERDDKGIRWGQLCRPDGTVVAQGSIPMLEAIRDGRFEEWFAANRTR